jgi:hypothetical protein
LAIDEFTWILVSHSLSGFHALVPLTNTKHRIDVTRTTIYPEPFLYTHKLLLSSKGSVLGFMAFSLDQFDKKQLMTGVAGIAATLMALCYLLVSVQTNSIKLWLYDTAQRHAKSATPSHVVVVAIDDASKARLGEWPWSNTNHAKLIDILRGAGATAVAFTTPLYTSNGGQPGDLSASDQLLINSMEQSKEVLHL